MLVKVYVEKPKKKRSSSIQQYHHHHHYYHIHHTVTQEVNDGSSSSNSSKGYDRKSGLLMYSRLLRNSVREGASSMPLLPSHSANNTIQPTNQVTFFKELKSKIYKVVFKFMTFVMCNLSFSNTSEYYLMLDIMEWGCLFVGFCSWILSRSMEERHVALEIGNF